MGYVSSTVKFDLGKLASLDRIAKECIVDAGDAVLTDIKMSQTMPFDMGELQNSSTFLDDGKKSAGQVSIVSSTPYARRLYYHPEYNFQRGKNSHAGGKWFEPYISGDKKDFAVSAYGKMLRRRGGL